MSQAKPEAMLASMILGVVKANGWVQMPIVVDVNLTYEKLIETGLPLNRDDAIEYTRRLVDVIADVHRPDGVAVKVVIQPEDEQNIRALFGIAYDQIEKEIKSK